MNTSTNYLTFNDDIVSDMMRGYRDIYTDRFVEFLKAKNEKITFNSTDGRHYINTFFPSFPGKAWNQFLCGITRLGMGERVPLQADLVVTGKCHCNCWHCFRAKYSDQNQLSLATIRELIASLEKLGTAVVGITGGEPMLRRDILEVLQLLPETMEGQLYTTGVHFTREFVRELEKTNVKRVIISLDHYEEKQVIESRNNINAFHDAVNALTLLKDSTVYAVATVCVNDALSDTLELSKYVEFVKELGVDEIRMVSIIPQGKLDGAEVAKKHLKSQKVIREVKAIYDPQKEYPGIVNFGEVESFTYLGCGAGSNYVSVNSDGNVTPCVSVPLSFGNIYDRKLESIYADMGKYFTNSSCSCVGVAVAGVIDKNGISVEKPPYNQAVSERIIKECKCSMRAASFLKMIRGEL